MRMVQLGIRIDLDLKTYLQKKAKQERISISDVLRKLVIQDMQANFLIRETRIEMGVPSHLNKGKK